ncbi:hypothetical protein [Antribacter gilvus]|uniref:hypothetical protein n=1 Tax=Antribacter gilvus TaxID=2304675 RepID=UPI000F76DB0F|nr:hypothetical protein [Antribacter gilvus]
MPTVVLLLLGGTVADRFGARRIMILGDATMLAVLAGLAVVVLGHGASLWLLDAASVVRGALGVLASVTSAGFAAGVCAAGLLSCAVAGTTALMGLAGSATKRPV